MFLTRRLAACTALIAALALPVASASAAPPPGGDQGQGSPHCPSGYSGPLNAATGCPWYVMVYDTPAAPQRLATAGA